MLSIEQLAFVFLPPVLLIASGTAAVFRPPQPWVRSGILHLAAGVVFAVVAVELIPDLLRDHQPIDTVIGFGIGVAAMLALRSFTNSKNEGDEEPSEDARVERLPFGMLSGVAIDLVVDGLMIGIGFAAGAKEGRLLAVALAIELVALGLAVAASMSELGIARARSIKVLVLLSLAFVAGAGIGTTLLGFLTHWLDGVLAFGAAALLFLVTEELLTEAHEEKESPTLTAMFFLGFLAFLVLGIVG